MRIILKPAGAITVGTAISALVVITVMSLVSRPGPKNLPMLSAPTTIPATDGKTAPFVDALGQERTSGKKQTIYSEGFQNGWQFRPREGNVTPSASGSNRRAPIVVKVGASVSLWHEPFDVAPYDRIVFRWNGGGTGGQTVQVVGSVCGQEQSPVTLPPNQTTSVVSLEHLGIARRFSVDGFRISHSGDTPISVEGVTLLTPTDSVP